MTNQHFVSPFINCLLITVGTIVARAQADEIVALPDQAKDALTYLNKIRANPRAFSAVNPKKPKQDNVDWHAEIHVKLSYVKRRPPLIWNKILEEVAMEKARELAKESIRQEKIVISHVSPNGEGINIRMHRAGYSLRRDWLTPKSSNNFENLGSKSDTKENVPKIGQMIINQLINDGGEPNGKEAGHRISLLAMNKWNVGMKDVGISIVRFKLKPDDPVHYFLMVLVLGRHDFR